MLNGDVFSPILSEAFLSNRAPTRSLDKIGNLNVGAHVGAQTAPLTPTHPLSYIPESPRWLLLNGRPEAALRVLQRTARGNGLSLPPGATLRSAGARPAAGAAAGPPAEGVTSLFKYRKVAGWTLIMMFSW